MKQKVVIRQTYFYKVQVNRQQTLPGWNGINSQLNFISRLKLCQMPCQCFIRRSSTCFLPPLSVSQSVYLTMHWIVRRNQLGQLFSGDHVTGQQANYWRQINTTTTPPQYRTYVHTRLLQRDFQSFQTSVNRMTRSGKNEDM